MSLVMIVFASFLQQVCGKRLLCAEDTEAQNRPASLYWWRWDDGVKILTITNDTVLLP